MNDMISISRSFGKKGGGIDGIIRLAILAPLLLLAYYLLYVIAALVIAAICYACVKGIFWLIEAHTHRSDYEVAFGAVYGLLLISVTCAFLRVDMPVEAPSQNRLPETQGLAASTTLAPTSSSAPKSSWDKERDAISRRADLTRGQRDDLIWKHYLAHVKSHKSF